MPLRKSAVGALFLAAGIFAVVVVFVWQSESETSNNVLLEVATPEAESSGSQDNTSFTGSLQLGTGWCLDAREHKLGAQASISKCDSDDDRPQEWTYNFGTGLLQLAGGNLCLHADYLSEPDGALTSLQPCKEGSKRQSFVLDGATKSVRLKHAPSLCAQSANNVQREGQPVLVLSCDGSAQKEAAAARASESTLQLLAEVGGVDQDEKDSEDDEADDVWLKRMESQVAVKGTAETEFFPTAVSSSSKATKKLESLPAQAAKKAKPVHHQLSKETPVHTVQLDAEPATKSRTKEAKQGQSEEDKKDASIKVELQREKANLAQMQDTLRKDKKTMELKAELKKEKVLLKKALLKKKAAVAMKASLDARKPVATVAKRKPTAIAVPRVTHRLTKIEPKIAPGLPKARASTISAMESQAVEAAQRIRVAVARRHAAEITINQEVSDAEAAAEQAKHAAAILHKSPPQKVIAALAEAHTNAQKKLVALVGQEKEVLHSVVAQFEDQFNAKTVEAKNKALTAKKLARTHASVLRRQAKLKAAAVIASARKSLRKVVKESLKVVTGSTDKRQRARANLVKLRSHHGDEVSLAEAALSLAKINTATHQANVAARHAARVARVKAVHKIQFARTMLATRLKAIHSTELLASDKAELQSRAVIAEAQELLSRAKQQVLMALDAADASVPLDQVVPKEDVVENIEERRQGLHGMVSRGGMQDFSQMEDTGAAESREEEELVGRKMVQSKVDTIYTAKMQRCIFPFMDRGQKYYHCKASRLGRWCATKVDASKKVQKWDYCVLNKHAVSLAKEAAMAAAKIEITRVLAATGAKITPEALRESLRAAAAAQQGPATMVQQASAKKTAAQPAGPRVMGSHTAKSKVDEMIDDDATALAKRPRVRTLHSPHVETLHSVHSEQLDESPVPTLRRQPSQGELQRHAGRMLEEEVGTNVLKENNTAWHEAAENLIQEDWSEAADKNEQETLKLLLESGDPALLA